MLLSFAKLNICNKCKQSKYILNMEKCLGFLQVLTKTNVCKKVYVFSFYFEGKREG